MIDKYADILITDKELKLLELFVSIKERTAEEIDEFVKIIVAGREQPDKNPHLKEKK